MADNSLAGFGKDPLVTSHGDALADQSFQSLKSKEIRDSLSPTEMKFQSMALNNPNTTGWNVQSSKEVSPDGRGFRAETIATTDGVESLNGGIAEFKGRNEQRSSAHHQGDDKNFVKKAMESSNSHLQEKVVLGDENSGRTEVRTSSSTSTSSSQVIQSSTNVEYDDGYPKQQAQPQKYLLDNNRHKLQQQEQQRLLEEQRIYEQQFQQQRQQHLKQQEHHATEQLSTIRQNTEQKNVSQNIQTQETHEQNKRYVDMDKASPEYQQHVQHLMQQPGEIISSTVEYPKPNVRMITTVKRLPDGTIVRNKRYETEEMPPTPTTPSTTRTTSSTPNQTQPRRDSHQQPTRNYTVDSPSTLSQDMVDSGTRYVHHDTLTDDVETKFSSIKKSSRKYSTETTSETIKEIDDRQLHGEPRSRGKPVTNDFSTQGFPSVRPNKPTQEYPSQRPHTARPTQGHTSAPSKLTETVVPHYPDATDNISERRLTTKDGEVIIVSSEKKHNYKTSSNSERIVETEHVVCDEPNYPQVPHTTQGFPSAVREPIGSQQPKNYPTEQDFPLDKLPPGTRIIKTNQSPYGADRDDDVVVVSSQKSHTAKHSTNTERIIEHEIIRDDQQPGYPRIQPQTDKSPYNYTVTTPGDQMPQGEFPGSPKKPNDRDFSTQGFPSVRTPVSSKPPSNDYSTQGFPSVKTPSRPSAGLPSTPSHFIPGQDREIYPNEQMPQGEFPGTPRKPNNTDFSTQGFPSVRTPGHSTSGHDREPYEVYPNGTPKSPSNDYTTQGFPAVKTPSRPAAGLPSSHNQHPTSPRKSPSQDFSTQGFPSVRSPTKSTPSQGYPTNVDARPQGTPEPTRSTPGNKTQPRTPSPTKYKAPTTNTVRETTERVIRKEKEVDSAHRAFAASLRSSSPIDHVRRDSYTTDSHTRHTPRSSVSSTRTFRRDMRESSHDSAVTPSETSRISTATITRNTPPRTVGGRTVVTKVISKTPTRVTKSPSPTKGVTKTSTTTTTTTTRTLTNKDVPKATEKSPTKKPKPQPAPNSRSSTPSYNNRKPSISAMTDDFDDVATITTSSPLSPSSRSRTPQKIRPNDNDKPQDDWQTQPHTQPDTDERRTVNRETTFETIDINETKKPRKPSYVEPNVEWIIVDDVDEYNNDDDDVRDDDNDSFAAEVVDSKFNVVKTTTKLIKQEKQSPKAALKKPATVTTKQTPRTPSKPQTKPNDKSPLKTKPIDSKTPTQQGVRPQRPLTESRSPSQTPSKQVPKVVDHKPLTKTPKTTAPSYTSPLRKTVPKTTSEESSLRKTVKSTQVIKEKTNRLIEAEKLKRKPQSPERNRKPQTPGSKKPNNEQETETIVVNEIRQKRLPEERTPGFEINEPEDYQGPRSIPFERDDEPIGDRPTYKTLQYFETEKNQPLLNYNEPDDEPQYGRPDNKKPQDTDNKPNQHIPIYNKPQDIVNEPYLETPNYINPQSKYDEPNRGSPGYRKPQEYDTKPIQEVSGLRKPEGTSNEPNQTKPAYKKPHEPLGTGVEPIKKTPGFRKPPSAGFKKLQEAFDERSPHYRKPQHTDTEEEPNQDSPVLGKPQDTDEEPQYHSPDFRKSQNLDDEPKGFRTDQQKPQYEIEQQITISEISQIRQPESEPLKRPDTKPKQYSPDYNKPQEPKQGLPIYQKPQDEEYEPIQITPGYRKPHDANKEPKQRSPVSRKPQATDDEPHTYHTPGYKKPQVSGDEPKSYRPDQQKPQHVIEEQTTITETSQTLYPEREAPKRPDTKPKQYSPGYHKPQEPKQGSPVYGKPKCEEYEPNQGTPDYRRPHDTDKKPYESSPTYERPQDTNKEPQQYRTEVFKPQDIDNKPHQGFPVYRQPLYPDNEPKQFTAGFQKPQDFDNEPNQGEPDYRKPQQVIEKQITITEKDTPQRRSPSPGTKKPYLSNEAPNEEKLLTADTPTTPGYKKQPQKPKSSEPLETDDDVCLTETESIRRTSNKTVAKHIQKFESTYSPKTQKPSKKSPTKELPQIAKKFLKTPTKETSPTRSPKKPQYGQEEEPSYRHGNQPETKPKTEKPQPYKPLETEEDETFEETSEMVINSTQKRVVSEKHILEEKQPNQRKPAGKFPAEPRDKSPTKSPKQVSPTRNPNRPEDNETFRTTLTSQQMVTKKSTRPRDTEYLEYSISHDKVVKPKERQPLGIDDDETVFESSEVIINSTQKRRVNEEQTLELEEVNYPEQKMPRNYYPKRGTSPTKNLNKNEQPTDKRPQSPRKNISPTRLLKQTESTTSTQPKSPHKHVSPTRSQKTPLDDKTFTTTLKTTKVVKEKFTKELKLEGEEYLETEPNARESLTVKPQDTDEELYGETCEFVIKSTQKRIINEKQIPELQEPSGYPAKKEPKKMRDSKSPTRGVSPTQKKPDQKLPEVPSGKRSQSPTKHVSPTRTPKKSDQRIPVDDQTFRKTLKTTETITEKTTKKDQPQQKTPFQKGEKSDEQTSDTDEDETVTETRDVVINSKYVTSKQFEESYYPNQTPESQKPVRSEKSPTRAVSPTRQQKQPESTGRRPQSLNKYVSPTRTDKKPETQKKPVERHPGDDQTVKKTLRTIETVTETIPKKDHPREKIPLKKGDKPNEQPSDTEEDETITETREMVINSKYVTSKQFEESFYPDQTPESQKPIRGTKSPTRDISPTSKQKQPEITSRRPQSPNKHVSPTGRRPQSPNKPASPTRTDKKPDQKLLADDQTFRKILRTTETVTEKITKQDHPHDKIPFNKGDKPIPQTSDTEEDEIVTETCELITKSKHITAKQFEESHYPDQTPETQKPVRVGKSPTRGVSPTNKQKQPEITGRRPESPNKPVSPARTQKKPSEKTPLDDEARFTTSFSSTKVVKERLTKEEEDEKYLENKPRDYKPFSGKPVDSDDSETVLATSEFNIKRILNEKQILKFEEPNKMEDEPVEDRKSPVRGVSPTRSPKKPEQKLPEDFGLKEHSGKIPQFHTKEDDTFKTTLRTTKVVTEKRTREEDEEYPKVERPYHTTDKPDTKPKEHGPYSVKPSGKTPQSPTKEEEEMFKTTLRTSKVVTEKTSKIVDEEEQYPDEGTPVGNAEKPERKPKETQPSSHKPLHEDEDETFTETSEHVVSSKTRRVTDKIIQEFEKPQTTNRDISPTRKQKKPEEIPQFPKQPQNQPENETSYTTKTVKTFHDVKENVKQTIGEFLDREKPEKKPLDKRPKSPNKHVTPLDKYPEHQSPIKELQPKYIRPDFEDNTDVETFTHTSEFMHSEKRILETEKERYQPDKKTPKGSLSPNKERSPTRKPSPKTQKGPDAELAPTKTPQSSKDDKDSPAQNPNNKKPKTAPKSTPVDDETFQKSLRTKTTDKKNISKANKSSQPKTSDTDDDDKPISDTEDLIIETCEKHYVIARNSEEEETITTTSSMKTPKPQEKKPLKKKPLDKPKVQEPLKNKPDYGKPLNTSFTSSYIETQETIEEQTYPEDNEQFPVSSKKPTKQIEEPWLPKQVPTKHTTNINEQFIETEKVHKETPDGSFVSKTLESTTPISPTSPTFKKKGTGRRDTFEERCRQILGMETYGDTPGTFKKQQISEIEESEKETVKKTTKPEEDTTVFQVKIEDCDDDDEPLSIGGVKKTLRKVIETKEKKFHEPKREETKERTTGKKLLEVVEPDEDYEVVTTNKKLVTRPESPEDEIQEFSHINTKKTTKTVSKPDHPAEDKDTELVKTNTKESTILKKTPPTKSIDETEPDSSEPETVEQHYISKETKKSEIKILKKSSPSSSPRSSSPIKAISPSARSVSPNKTSASPRSGSPNKTSASPRHISPLKETPKRKPRKDSNKSTPQLGVNDTTTIKERLTTSTFKTKSPGSEESSPDVSPTRFTERRRSSNISVTTEIIIEHTDSDTPHKKEKSPESVYRDIMDSTVMPEKLTRRLPVTERKESAPVHRVTNREKDSKMSRSTSEKLIKVNKKPEPQTLTPKAEPKTSEHRRPNKCFATKSINLSATDRLINTQDMESVIIDIQHAKSSREPSPDKIVPTPVPAHLDTGKPRYPDKVQEPEDEQPRKRPQVKNIPIFEEEHNAYVGLHISEVNVQRKDHKTTYDSLDYEEQILNNPVIEAPASLDYTSMEKPLYDESLLTVHEKVSKFQNIAEELKKPQQSDVTKKQPKEEECFVIVDITRKPKLTGDNDEDEEFARNERIYSSVKLAPTVPQRSPELVRTITRNISKQNEPNTVEELQIFYDDDDNQDYRLTSHNEDNVECLLNNKKITEEFEVSHQQQQRQQQKTTTEKTFKTAEKYHLPKHHNDNENDNDDDDDNDDDELIPHTKTHTTKIEERRQKDILNRPSVFAARNKKPTTSFTTTTTTTKTPLQSNNSEKLRTDNKSRPLKPTTTNTNKTSLTETDTTKTTITTPAINQQSPQRKHSAGIDYDDYELRGSGVETGVRNIISKQTKVYNSSNNNNNNHCSSSKTNDLKHTTTSKNNKPEKLKPSVVDSTTAKNSDESELSADNEMIVKVEQTQEDIDIETQVVNEDFKNQTTNRKIPLTSAPHSSTNSSILTDQLLTGNKTKEHVVKLTEKEILKSNKKVTSTQHEIVDHSDEEDIDEIVLESTKKQHSSKSTKMSAVNLDSTVAARRSLFESSSNSMTPTKRTPLASPSSGRRPSYMDHTKSSLEHTRRDSLEINKTNYSRKPSHNEEEIAASDRSSMVKFEIAQGKRATTPRATSVSEDINVEEIYELEILERLLETVQSYEIRRRIRAQIRLIKKNQKNELISSSTEVLAKKTTKTSKVEGEEMDSVGRKPKTVTKDESSHVSSTKKEYIFEEAYRPISRRSPKISRQPQEEDRKPIRSQSPQAPECPRRAEHEKQYERMHHSPERREHSYQSPERKQHSPDRQQYSERPSPETQTQRRKINKHEHDNEPAHHRPEQPKHSEKVRDYTPTRQSPERSQHSPERRQHLSERQSPETLVCRRNAEHEEHYEQHQQQHSEEIREIKTRSTKEKYYYKDEHEHEEVNELRHETSPSRKSPSPTRKTLSKNSSPERRNTSPESTRTLKTKERSRSPQTKKPQPARVTSSRSPDSKISSTTVRKTSNTYEQQQQHETTLKTSKPQQTKRLTNTKSKPEDKTTPVWADRKNILKAPSSTTPTPKKPSSTSSTLDSRSGYSKTIKSSTQQKMTTSKTSFVDDDCVTSSYGIGPTDENGLPLFGIRALKKKKPTVEPSETTEEVTGYVVEEKYYSDNKTKPTVERKEFIYSTNPDELQKLKHQVESSGSRKALKDVQVKETRQAALISKATPALRSSPEDDFLGSTTKYVRRGSVKEMSEKFIQKKAASSNVTEKSNNYPKAGLILRTNSRKNSRDTDNENENFESYKTTRVQHHHTTSSSVLADSDDAEHEYEVEEVASRRHSGRFITESESECDSIKTQREFKKITSSSSSSVATRSFLNSQGEEKVVTNASDCLERMRNADNVVEEGDTAEDQEARALLNKFLGASIIMKGVESSRPASSNRQSKIITTTTTNSSNLSDDDDIEGDNNSKHEVKTTRITKTIKSGSSSTPVTYTTCDIEEIWDEEILKELLEQARTYEERRKIRSRLRELMADREETKQSPNGEKEDKKVAAATAAATTAAEANVSQDKEENSASEYEEIIEEVTDYSETESEVDEKKQNDKVVEVVKKSSQDKEQTSEDVVTKTEETSVKVTEKSEISFAKQEQRIEEIVTKTETKTETEIETVEEVVEETDSCEKGESLKPLVFETKQTTVPPTGNSQSNRSKTNSQKLQSEQTSSNSKIRVSESSSMQNPQRHNYTTTTAATYSLNANVQTKGRVEENTIGHNNQANSHNRNININSNSNVSGSSSSLGGSCVVVGSKDSPRQVERLGVPQKEDSGTESGEDLRLIAAGLRDQLQIQSDANIIEDVTSALSRLENSLKEGKDISVDSEKRKALLALVDRLRAGLTSPEKLAEIAAAMSELDGNEGVYGETSSPEADAHRSNRARFAKRRQRINRHTVGVSREELADARRYMEDMLIMGNISQSPITTTPEVSSKTNNTSPPQWYALEKNASLGAIMTQSSSSPQILKRPKQFEETETSSNMSYTNRLTVNNGKRRPLSGEYSVSFENPTVYRQQPEESQLNRQTTKQSSPPEESSKFSRFTNKKHLMKRANTIDLAKGHKYHTEFDTDSDAEDKGPHLGLKRAVQVSVKKRVGNVVPPFEPKTENDRKFLAFINKQSDKPGLGWTSSRSVSNWTNKFGSIKNTFEGGLVGKPPQVPHHTTSSTKFQQNSKLFGQSSSATAPAATANYITNQQIALRLQQEAERQADERRRKLERERLEYERRERDKLERQRQQRERQERERLERELFERQRREQDEMAANHHAAILREQQQLATNNMNVPKPIPINEFKHAPQSVFRPIDNGDTPSQTIYKPIAQFARNSNNWQTPYANPRGHGLATTSPGQYGNSRPDNSFITSPPPSTRSPIALPWASKPTVDNSSFKTKANRFEERSKYDNIQNAAMQRHNSLRSANDSSSQTREDFRKRPSLPNTSDPYSVGQDPLSYLPPPQNISFTYSNLKPYAKTYQSFPCLPLAVVDNANVREYQRSREDSLTDPYAQPLVLTSTNPSYCPATQAPSQTQEQPFLNQTQITKQFDLVSPVASTPTSPSCYTMPQTDYTDDDLDSDNNLLEYHAVSRVMGKPQSQTAVTVGRRTGHVSDDELYGKNSRAAKNLLNTMKSIGNTNGVTPKVTTKTAPTKRSEVGNSPKTCLSPDGRSYQAPLVEPLFPDINNFETKRQPAYIDESSSKPTCPQATTRKPLGMYKSMENLNRSAVKTSDKRSSFKPYVSETQSSYVVTYPIDDTDDEDYSRHGQKKMMPPNNLELRTSRNVSENSTGSSTTNSMSYSQNLPSPNTSWTSNPIVVEESGKHQNVATAYRKLNNNLPTSPEQANYQAVSSYSGVNQNSNYINKSAEYGVPAPGSQMTTQQQQQQIPTTTYAAAASQPFTNQTPNQATMLTKKSSYEAKSQRQLQHQQQQLLQNSALQNSISTKLPSQQVPETMQRPAITKKPTDYVKQTTKSTTKALTADSNQEKRSVANKSTTSSSSINQEKRSLTSLRKTVSEDHQGSVINPQHSNISQEMLRRLDQQRERISNEMRRKSLGNALDYQMEKQARFDTQQEYKSSAPADTPDIVKSSLPKDESQPILKKFGPPQRHHYMPNSYQSPSANITSSTLQTTSSHSTKIQGKNMHSTQQSMAKTSQHIFKQTQPPTVMETPATPQPDDDYIPRNIVYNNVSAFTSMNRRQDADNDGYSMVQQQYQNHNRPNKLSKSDSWNQIMLLQNQNQQQVTQQHTTKFNQSPTNELRRTKSGHSLVLPKMYEAAMTKTDSTEKQKTVAAYFSGQKSPTQQETMVEQQSPKRSVINRTKTSEKVSAATRKSLVTIVPIVPGGLQRSATMPHIANISLLDESNVEDAFEQLIMGS